MNVSRAPYIPTILRILFPRNIYRTHASALYSPAFLSNPLRRTFDRPARHSLLPIAFSPHLRFPKKRPNRAPRCSHHFALTYLPLLLRPVQSHTPAPFTAHLRTLRHAPTTPCAIAALVSHHSVSTSAPIIIAARPLFSPFHSFHFPRRSPKHHTPAPLTLTPQRIAGFSPPAHHSPARAATQNITRQHPSRFTPQRIAGFSPRRTTALPAAAA